MFDLFLTFDTCILNYMHIIGTKIGTILTPVCRVITILGSKGCLMLIIGAILLINHKTRKYGIAMIGALACSYLCNDIILKHIFLRERPFAASEVFRQYMNSIKSKPMDGYSFPSGHVTGIAAGCFAFVFMLPKGASKKYFIIAIIAPFVMAFSRIYLMHHYPSDCIFGIVSGIVYALVASVITKWMYVFMKKYNDVPLFNFVLTWSPLNGK